MSNSKAFMFGCMFMATIIATIATTEPVSLGSASKFVILSKSGISTVPPSVVKGNIGVSPIAATAMTGFSLKADSSNAFSTSDQITGRAYAANYAAPSPSDLTTAILDMEAAYTDASGRASSDENLNSMSGLVSGITFKPGVYTWKSDIMFSSDLYIKGSSEDTFIFQSTGNLVVGSGAKIILVDDGSGKGMPKSSNVFWQVAGYVNAGTTSHLEGIFLVKTHFVMKTGSSLNGKIFAQTACTLDSATIIDSNMEDNAGAIMKKPLPADDAKIEDVLTVEKNNVEAPSGNVKDETLPPIKDPSTVEKNKVEAPSDNEKDETLPPVNNPPIEILPPIKDPSTIDATPTDNTLDGDTAPTDDSLPENTGPTNDPWTEDTGFSETV